uniref:Ig-like domain-containing protein n=1 Tax=Lepisosteus oculatus TaxID=7918 RepID=W5MKK8_LEPOC
CPVEISPQRAVVRYGDPVTAKCTTTQTARGIGWEATVGATGMKTDVQSVTWNVSSLTDWTAEPKCYGNFLTEPKQCGKNLIIILYKYPDSVSLSSDSPVDQMVEGIQYQLQCEIKNIAPIQNLTVNWYRGQTLIHNQTFSHNTTRTPGNVSATLLFTPDRADNGQQLTCEAELNLGPEGPQPPPTNQSDPLSITMLLCPGAVPECPLEISPQRAVVRYGDPVTVNCTATQTPRGMGWEAPVGSTGMRKDVQSVIWNVSSLTHWTAEPKCFGNFNTEPRQCRKNLNIRLYKYPDSVSINSGSPVVQMVEGRQYQLQCEVQNIVPVQYLTVNWYRGQTLIHSQTFSHNTTRTPVNVSAALLFTPDRADNGQQLTCEAELNLGPEGPQPPPAKQSDPLLITLKALRSIGLSSEDCPIQIRPSRLVVRYGDPVRAECTATQPLRGMGWEATAGPTGMQIVSQVVTWNVSSLTDWTSEPKCFGNFYQTPKQCEKKLTIVLYKLPDSVSLNQTVQMVEGRQYQLQCEVQNIAPVQYLTVNWYRGKTLIHSRTFSHNTTRTPVNVSATLLFTPDRADNGQQFTCEAELNLGPEGPQPPPAKRGKPVMITVLYKPVFTSTGPTAVQVPPGTRIFLNSSADGNPPPTFEWKYSSASRVQVTTNRDTSVAAVTVNSEADAGAYTCIAANTEG